jgi:hypothetical protein
VRLNVPGYLLRVVTVDSVVGLLPIDNILAEILVAGRLMKSGREHPAVVVVVYHVDHFERCVARN